LNGKFEGRTFKIIDKQLSHYCVATSCVAEWESADDQMPEGMKKGYESYLSAANSDSYNNEIECKLSSSAGKATGIGMLALAVTAAASALFFF
jgi:hypothetical protein